MKIGFVLDDGLDRGDGVQQYILTLGKWLSDQGEDVHYLVGQTKRQDIANVHSLSKNVFVRFNGNRMSIPLPAKRGPIKVLLDKEQFDILHIQMPYSPFLASKIIKAAPVGTAVVGTFHILPYGALQTRGASVLSMWTKATTAKLKQIWSVSKPAQQFAASLGIKSTVLPNVVDLAKFNVAKPKPSDQIEIVFLGRLVPRKGCAELLKAFEVVAGKLPNVHLSIGGTGPQAAALEQWVIRHQLHDRVSFAGFIDEARKANFLAKADLAVFPSLGGESFGIVLIEAMASGASLTLGGDNDGYSSVLGSLPETLFNPRHTQKFADLLLEMITNEPKRLKLGAKQQQLVKDFDVVKIGQKLLSYYKEQ